MLNCRACMRRATIAVLQDTSLITTNTSQLRTISTLRPPQSRISLSRPVSFTPANSLISTSRRQHSTVQSIRQGHHRKLLVDALRKKKPILPNIKRNNRTLTVVEERDLRARTNNASHLDIDNDQTALTKKASYEVQFVVGDPLELANAVLSKLRDGNFPMALELVRASEKGPKPQPGERVAKTTNLTIDNVVSWNHLMDWLMEKRDTATAMKVYNEMKKRGHKPDSYTYTIMLSGLSRNSKKPDAVKNAVKVYDSISAANSVVTPNVIHANAVLSVCSRVGDMDSLWSIAGRLPEKGNGAPNAWTYTTILNAIRHDAIMRASKVKTIDGKDAQVGRIFEDAINDARKMWREIIAKWQKGDLQIDEPLVCAMGRLLMASNKRADAENVYDLVEQSMNIRINKQTLPSIEQLDEHTQGQEAVTSQPSPVPMNMSVEIAQPIRTQAYPVPDNNTLSMLIEATTITRQTHIGKAFWDILTTRQQGFAVKPDTGSIVAYLRLLRLSRASKMSLDILRQDWPENIAHELFTNRGTFVIAMSTCVRDKNNPNVFETAGRIVDLMQDKVMQSTQTTDSPTNRMPKGQMLDLDPKVLTMYLSLTMATPRGYDAATPLGQYEGRNMDLKFDPRWDNLLRALKRLGADAVNISQMTKLKITEVEQSKPTSWPRRRSEDRFVEVNQIGERLEDLVGLLKGMISSYDRVLAANYRLQEANQEQLDKQFMEDCRLQKRKLSALISKVDENIVRQTDKTGLWEGYDPAKQATARQGVDEAEEDTRDREFTKTPGLKTLEKSAWREQKISETQQANKRLSRRQIQEKERDRRDERNRTMHTPRRSRDSPQRNGTPLVQDGWGGEYQKLAEKTGIAQSAGLVEL